MTADDYILMIFIMSIGTSVSVLIGGGSYFISNKIPDGAKVSAYECGFDPFGTARAPLAVRFFLVGVLFIVFDIEISYVFPWTLSYNRAAPTGYWAMFAFLIILTVGFLYEWARGGMEWDHLTDSTQPHPPQREVKIIHGASSYPPGGDRLRSPAQC